MIRLAFSFAMLACICTIALAKPSDKSQTAYFPVKGKTPKEIHDNIKVAAPKIGPGAVYAFTIPAVKHVKKLRKGKDICSYSSHTSLGHYIFVLPKLSASKGASAKTLSDWRSFVGYLKTHEEGHRSIWRKCLAEYDAAVLKLTAKTCEKLDQQRENLFTKIKLRCVQEDERYDFQFRKDVQKQAFVKAALKG